MSKSKGNFFTFRDLKEQGYSPLELRYLLLSVPYRKQLNFTFDGLHGAESTIERLRNFRSLVKDANTVPGSRAEITALVKTSLTDFELAMDDDFNTAAALAAVHNLVREINTVLAKDELLADDQAAVLRTIEKFDLLSEWYYDAILELTRLKSFKGGLSGSSRCRHRGLDRRTSGGTESAEFCPLG